MKLQNIVTDILLESYEQNRDKIINAIQNKRVLTIYYKAGRDEHEKTGWRRIEPFCCGINHHGNPVLRAWQSSGVSNTYPPGKDGSNGGKIDPLTYVPGWRMFRMDKIVAMQIGWDKFTAPRPKYNPQDKDMSSIFAAADFGTGNRPVLVNPNTPQPTAPVQQQPTTPAAQPQPQQPVVQKPVVPQPPVKTDVLPQIKPQPNKHQSYMDKLTDKFKRLINYKPKK